MSANWPIVRIDDIKAPEPGSIAIGPFGSRMKSDCYVEDGIPVIRGTNITGGPTFEGEFVYITEEKADTLGSSNVYQSDLVFPHRGSIGEVGIILEDKRYVLSSSLMKLTCDRAKVNPKFLYYFFKSSTGRHELLKNASQVGTPGIGQPLTSLKGIEFRLPPLAVQDRIEEILSSLDNKIELNRQTNQTLEQIAQAIFKSWFVDFDPVRAKIAAREAFIQQHPELTLEAIRSAAGTEGDTPAHAAAKACEIAAMCAISGAVQGRTNVAGAGATKAEEQLGELDINTLQQLKAISRLFPDVWDKIDGRTIPNGWSVENISEICVTTDYVANGSFKALKENVTLYDKPNDVLYVRTTDFNKGFSNNLKYTDLNSYEFLKKSKLHGRETIISNVGDVGTVFRAPSWLGLPMTLGSNAVALISDEFSGYLFWFFKSYTGQTLLDGIVTGSAQLKFNKTNLRSLELALPSKEMLDEFEKLDLHFHNKSNSIMKEINLLETLRDLLLPKLLSGEMEVAHAD